MKLFNDVLSRLGFYQDDVGWMQALLLKAPGYGKRLLRACCYCALLIIIAGVFALIIALAICVLLPAGSGMLEAARVSLSSALGLAYPVWIDELGVHASIGADSLFVTTETAGFDVGLFLLCCLEVLLIGLLSLVFSGSFSNLFLRPINPIKMSPVVIFSEVRQCVSAQLWICYSKYTYLQDVEISVSAFSDNVYDDVAIDLGEGWAGATHSIAREQLTALRGVWEVRIPYESDGGKRLKRFFNEHRNDNPGIQFTIKGTAPSGGSVVAIGRYDWRRILIGEYDFAAYRCSGKNKKDSPMHQVASYINFARVVDLEPLKKMSSDYCAEIKNASPSTVELVRKPIEVDAGSWRALLDGIIKGFSADQRAERDERIRRITIEPDRDWNPTMSIADWIELIKL